MHIANLPRFALAQLPTSMESLPRLTRELGGPRLLIKRDDQTDLALGRNQTRKREFLLVKGLANECAHHNGSAVRLTKADVQVVDGDKGEGCGVVGDLEGMRFI